MRWTKTDLDVLCRELAALLVSEDEYTNNEIMAVLTKRHGYNGVLDMLKMLRNLNVYQEAGYDRLDDEEGALS